MPILITGKFLFKGQDIVHKTEKQMQAIRGKEIAMIFPRSDDFIRPNDANWQTSGGIINQT